MRMDEPNYINRADLADDYERMDAYADRVAARATERPFAALPDDWLDAIAVALYVAAHEGGFDHDNVRGAIRAEYQSRQRFVPMPWGQPDIDPAKWLEGW